MRKRVRALDTVEMGWRRRVVGGCGPGAEWCWRALRLWDDSVRVSEGGGAVRQFHGDDRERCRVLRLVETGPTVAGAGHGVETQCQ